MSDFHTLTVKNITRETTKAVVVAFDVPETVASAFAFTPGQYITLEKEINGSTVRRAYSICSAANSAELCVAIKEIENGVFSSYANQSLQVGDTMAVHTPEGNFTLSPSIDTQHTYAAFAAGSGITPIMSMIKTVLSTTTDTRFVLAYGNQSPDQTMFLEALQSLQTSYPDRLFVELFYSRTQEAGAHFGRIEQSTINYIIKNKFKDTDFEAFYLCGPEAMIQTVSDVLVAQGIDKTAIYFELFTSSSTSTEVAESLDGNATITILVDDEESTFVMDQKHTILDAALAKDIDAPYSCQGGVCSSCICRVVEGSATMEKNSILTDSEIAEGLVLACQAHPTSAVIKIDFDDV